MKELILNNFPLQKGGILAKAKLVYQTYGELNSDRSNAILYPTSYGATHQDIDWLIRPDGILDPRRWFIIIPNMFGNGLSSSPSNLEGVSTFTHVDNVAAQEILVREVWKIDRLALIYGWSMGAQQAYHWGVLYPERVAKIAALCGTARTTDHNKIFLLSLRSALTTDPAWNGEKFTRMPEKGWQTFARIYASWAASQAFYRQGIYYQLGYNSLEDYLVRGWEANYRQRDPHNLLAMIDTWLACDVSDNSLYNGDYPRALGSISAPTLIMPSSTDLYFTPEDCKYESILIPNAEYCPIPSIWGHRAGNPYQNPTDAAFIRQEVNSFLQK